MGTLLLGLVRAGDVACRYGGEEFALILPAAPLPVLAERAEVIRQAVSTLTSPTQHPELPPITASLGASVVVNAEVSVTTALAHADAALYAAKRTGRNRVVVHAGECMPSPARQSTARHNSPWSRRAVGLSEQSHRHA